MVSSPTNRIYDWLHQLKIPVSRNYLKFQLQSHPDYPSLASITDVLDELYIENTAIEIDKDQLPELPVPFLAHLRSNGGEYVVVKNRDNLEKQFTKFFERWSGVVVLAEKPNNRSNEENSKWLLKENRERQKIAASAGLLSVFIIATFFSEWQWQHIVSSLIAISGIFVSWLITSKDLGIENKIADQVCGKEASCDAVIKSKGSRLPLGISWSDAGMIWFSFLLLALLIGSFTKTTPGLYSVLFLFAACSLTFTLFSIYYQWHIVKKWCRLCLLIVVLLWTQFIILLPGLNPVIKWELQPDYLLNEALVLFFVTTSWLAIKSLLKTSKKTESENFSNLRFKNNSDVFTVLLQKQRKIDATPFENDLQLGNPDSDIQIMVACNPYCGPCSWAHAVLDELLERNDIGLTIRFGIKTENREDKKLEAVSYLLQLSNDKEANYKRKLLRIWYEKMDFEDFRKQYQPSLSPDVQNQLRQHEEWSRNAEIYATPAIFINGYGLPKQYKAEDLRWIIKYLEIKETIKPEYNYSPV